MGATPVNTISSVGAVRVRFSISENDYLDFRKKVEAGARADSVVVELILSSGEVFPEKGKLDFADRTVDPTTGSLLVQAIFENKNRLLKPGQYGKVRFKTAEVPNAILVPQQAVNQLQNIFQVYVVDDSNRVAPRPVKTGFRIGSNWVITEGLKAGEKVALLGNAVVKPKMVVQPVAKEWSYDSTSVQ
jgi:membrane fusion protein (multidrug efflux system)